MYAVRVSAALVLLGVSTKMSPLFKAEGMCSVLSRTSLMDKGEHHFVEIEEGKKK